MGAHHLVDALDTFDAFGYPAFREHVAVSVFDADVVMGLGPVDPDVDHRSPFPLGSSSLGGAKRRTNGSVLRWHDIPPAVVSPHRPAGAPSSLRARIAQSVSVLARRRLRPSMPYRLLAGPISE